MDVLVKISGTLERETHDEFSFRYCRCGGNMWAHRFIEFEESSNIRLCITMHIAGFWLAGSARFHGFNTDLESISDSGPVETGFIYFTCHFTGLAVG